MTVLCLWLCQEGQDGSSQDRSKEFKKVYTACAVARKASKPIGSAVWSKNIANYLNALVPRNLFSAAHSIADVLAILADHTELHLDHSKKAASNYSSTTIVKNAPTMM
jgi:hypothetical protein